MKRFTAEQIIIFMSTEDGLAGTIKPRLKIMGADPKRVFAVNTALTLDPDGFKQLESYLKGSATHAGDYRSPFFCIL